ncbi:DUF1120 domain-containing protein [Pectobacterium punjabense]|uniref:DUF1120 domain-containing protein n=1 Tax=Pectobacterium punjabense TaxID=2108399 RepID=UPI0024060933|nr:DUF1120 domain-containing protein [Pectobacterium punjabense]MDG0798617.1 DUF1120 domain-containing protein [Pectobacterium punjabense]
MMMMNTVTKTACALAVLAATSTSVMAESIDVRVIGTITPTACKPTLSGGGTIDYGVISPASLKKDSLNQLGIKSVDFAITCDAPAKVALKAINGRPNTVAGRGDDDKGGASYRPDNIGSAVADYVVGLGLDGNKKIGGYAIAMTNVSADGKSVDYGIQGLNSGDKWAKYGKSYFYYSVPVISSWFKPGTTDPIAFTTLVGKLDVQAYINKTSELDLSKPVKLDGLTTLEMHYL